MSNRIITALAAILAIPAMAAPAGYFQVPGTETTMKVYGKAETWGFYNLNNGAGNDGRILVADDDTTPLVDEEVPVLGDQSWSEKNTVDSAVYGRIGVTTTTPSAYGDVNVKVELQAKSGGSANAGSLNLRHAYGEFGGLLIGQTTSLFFAWQYCPAYNDTWHPDFNGGTYRTRQIRYTLNPTKAISVAFSAEQDLSGGTSTKIGQTFVGAFQYSADWGNVVAAALYQKTRTFDNTGVGTAGHGTTSSSGTGVSFNVGGSWNITSNDTLGLRIIKGGGQGGSSVNELTDGFKEKANGDLDFYTSTSWDLGYAHVWNDKFTSNVGIGQIVFPKDTDLGVGDKATVSEFFVNTNWAITKNATFGVEYFDSSVKYSDTNPIVKVDGSSTNKYNNNGFNVMFQYNFF